MGEIVLPYHVQADGSRSFTRIGGPEQYLRTTAAPATEVPLTINCWAYLYDNLNQALVSLTAADVHYFEVRATSVNAFRASTRAGTATNATTLATVNEDEWIGVWIDFKRMVRAIVLRPVHAIFVGQVL